MVLKPYSRQVYKLHDDVLNAQGMDAPMYIADERSRKDDPRKTMRTATFFVPKLNWLTLWQMMS